MDEYAGCLLSILLFIIISAIFSVGFASGVRFQKQHEDDLRQIIESRDKSIVEQDKIIADLRADKGVPSPGQRMVRQSIVGGVKYLMGEK